MRIRGQREQALAELDAALAVSDQPGLLFPRRQALAHRAGTLLELGRPQEALESARAAVATPAEDVRSQVLGLRALGTVLRATGDESAGVAALTRALEVARSTGQRSEVAATERLLAVPPAG
jgi:tetratricopeptide (TPR) repeat protein